jgi:hypothetical protein
MAKVRKSDTAYSVTVSSQRTNGTMTVWALRDFVRALDEAGIPDDAQLVDEHNSDTRAFSGIRVRHTVIVEPSPDGAS